MLQVSHHLPVYTIARWHFATVGKQRCGCWSMLQPLSPLVASIVAMAGTAPAAHTLPRPWCLLRSYLMLNPLGIEPLPPLPSALGCPPITGAAVAAAVSCRPCLV
jgi:hypothetical protein